MLPIKCHHCKVVVTPDSDHRCSNCGEPLETAVSEPDASTIVADIPDVGNSPPDQPDDEFADTAASPNPSNLGIRLEYQHKFCIAKQHGSIPLRLTNQGRGMITELELVAKSKAFEFYDPPQPRKINLPANARTHFLPLDFDLADRSGSYVVELKGYYRDEKGNPNAFCGLLTLIVRDASKARVVVDDVWGGDLSNLLDMEAIEELEIRNSGGIDASRRVQRSHVGKGGRNHTDDWLPVELEEDFERTRSLNAWLKKRKERRDSPVKASLPVKNKRLPFHAGLLTIAEAGEEHIVHIWTRPRCQLGRSRPPADMVCVRLPANQHNGLISRHHCSLEVKDSTVFLSDGPSRNGTYLDHQRIDTGLPLHSGQTISLARQVDLDFRAFRQIDRDQHVSQIFNTCSSLSDCSRTLSQFDLESASQTAPLECYQLRRRDGYRHKLIYLFIQTAAPVGASASAAVQLNHDTVSPLHARLVYEDQSLFIEDLDTPAGTWVNGVQLKPYEPFALEEEAGIRLGDQHLHFRRLES